ncbi:MAG: phage major capsid protein [Terricaulis sp.]
MNRKTQLLAQLQAMLATARDIAAKAETEDRDLTGDERAIVTKALDDSKGIKAKLAELKADDEMLSAVKALGLEVVDGGDDDAAAGARTRPEAKARTGATLGGQFTDSPEFKGMLGQFPGGRIGDKARVQSSPVGFKTLLTGTSSTSAGALVNDDWRGLLDMGVNMRPLTVVDMISKGTTTSDTVEYARVNVFTNNAAPVAEATTADGADVNGAGDALELPAGSGVKPESALTFQVVSDTVKTIAHWIPATKRALSDASQVRSLIDSFLQYGLQEELEDQIVNGAGTGENFTGILSVSGVQSQAWSTDILQTTRKARTKVKTVGRATPTAYMLNPADWETIDLLQDNEARYFFGGPSRMGQPTLWGLPVIESEAIAAGTGLVGDFRQAMLWDREQASITVSDSHADFFIRNLVAILAEMRAGFGVIRPKAFVSIDLTA